MNSFVWDTPGQSRKTHSINKLNICRVLSSNNRIFIIGRAANFLHGLAGCASEKNLAIINSMVYFLRMKIKLTPQQIQKPILAPSMQQSIEVLMLPLAELSINIEKELQENPLLEIDEEKTAKEQQQIDQIVNFNLRNAIENPRGSTKDITEEDHELEERPITKATTLEEDLLRQLRIEITAPLTLKIGEFIVGNLDENGYLNLTCEEIAQILEVPDVTIVEEVLKTIQNFEPLGVASRNLQECLLTQVNYKFNGESQLIVQTIINHMEDLGHKRYHHIAKTLKTSIDRVKEIAKIIAALEPNPARNYRPIHANIYIKPDVTIFTDENGQYNIQINRDSVPHLRINSFYQQMLKQPNRTKEETDFIREKIKNALLFMRSIEQRHQTIKEIAKYIVNHQKDFFEQGPVALKPLILKDIAQVINRNESTVCRAINNKYMDTPQGLLPMKFFFSQSLPQEGSDAVSNRSIKEDLKTFIEEEDKNRPLSDQEIQQRFKNRGMTIARRTISKYRQTLHIQPSHLRKI